MYLVIAKALTISYFDSSSPYGMEGSCTQG